MNLLAEGNGQATEAGNHGAEGLDEERAAEAAALAGPKATEPMVDEITRELFEHTGYGDMDHMGG